MRALVSRQQLKAIRRTLARRGKRVVFTNGTFDILHRGHVEYLEAARRLGDVLIVGLNSDASIRRIKGNGRPINRSRDRVAVLAALRAVDYVCVFNEDTPARLIEAVVPDVLVKGADWKPKEIVGRDVVVRHGGVVRTIPLTRGRSTTGMIARILQVYRKRRTHRARRQPR
jgi:D-glycero-beta-D-manno-heptose 1-phosphate adenylyltransferase